ncbi:MAG: hypothetical protein AMXMBFR33_09950 [Candidatus Xenobia bacterium]
MQIRPVSGLPINAASPASSQLDQAARDLFETGHRLSTREKSFWKGEHWEPADPARAVEALSSSRPLKVETAAGVELPIASPEDLLEASALSGKGPVESLGSPMLAGSLKALESRGRLLADAQESNPFQAYNSLTQDANHPRPAIEFEVGPLKVRLQKPEDALTTAFLVAGFGDGTGVDPQARQLSELVRQGYSLSNGSALEAFHAKETIVSYQGIELGRPDEGLPQRRSELEQARALLKDQTKTWWPVLSEPSDRPLDERLELAQSLGSVEHYRLVLSQAGPGEELSQAAAPLGQVVSHLEPGSGEVKAAYLALRELPEEQRIPFLENLQRAQSTSLARQALTDPDLATLMQELEARRVPGHQLRSLISAALPHGPLVEQRELMLAALEYPDSVNLYQQWVQAMPPQARGEFLALRKDEPTLERLNPAWNALVQDSEHLAERREAYVFLRGQLPPESASERACSVLSQLRGENPRQAVAVYLDLSRSGLQDEAIWPVWQKLQESPEPQTALQLYGIARDAEQALTASRWLRRPDLPGQAEERRQALVSLAQAHEGDLGLATRDLLFVASKSEELAPAAEMLGELVRATGSSREARLAFTALQEMDPAQGEARRETLLRSLELVGSYHEAQPVWTALLAMPAAEGSKRLQGMDGRLELGPDQRGRLLAGQLARPLEGPAAASLMKILARPSLLTWTGDPGWEQRDGVWHYQDQNQSKDFKSHLVSSPIRLPEGENKLVLDARFLPSSGKSGLSLEIAEAGPSPKWSSLHWQADASDGPGQALSLLGWEGKEVVFRLQRYVNEGPASAELDFRSLKLSETRTGKIQRPDLNTWHQEIVGKDSNTTSGWIQLDPGPSLMRASVQYNMRTYANELHLEAMSEKSPSWRSLTRWSGGDTYATEEREVDLTPYSGQKIRLRYRLHTEVPGTASYNSPKGTMYQPSIIPIREDQSGAARLDLFQSGGLGAAQSEQLLSLAYGDQDAATRSRAIQTLGRLTEVTGSFDAAWKVWEKLGGEVGRPDFEDRAVAYGTLLSKGSEAAAAFELIERERAPGEKLEHAARLLEQRDAPSFLALRRRLQAERLEQPMADSVAFLASLKGSASLTDRIWEQVASPVLDEPLSERQKAFSRLAESTDGLDDALTLYAQTGQWLEPTDSFPAAVGAVAQLCTVLNRDAARVGQVLGFIQEKQQSGSLAGQTTGELVKRLVNSLVVRSQAPQDLDQALQELLIPQVGPGSVQEQEDKVIVGGVPVPRRAAGEAIQEN